MKKGQVYDVCWEKIENGMYPAFDIVEELIEILKENSKDEKYSNYSGDFQISVTINALKKRLEPREINSRKKKLTHVQIGIAVLSFLKKNELDYDPQKSRGAHSSAVYRCITYSREKLKKMLEWEDKINRTHRPYLFS